MRNDVGVDELGQESVPTQWPLQPLQIVSGLNPTRDQVSTLRDFCITTRRFPVVPDEHLKEEGLMSRYLLLIEKFSDV